MSTKAPRLPWATKSKKKVIDVTGGASSLSEQADDPLSALTRMAFPLAQGSNLHLAATIPVKEYDRKFKSRFFFRIDPSVAHHISLLREQETRSRVDAEEAPINQHVVARAKTLNKDIAPNVEKFIKQVREYLLTELGPFTMGAQGGLDQAREVVKSALDTDVEPDTLKQFDAMLRQGVQIKMARFLAKYLKLDPQDAEVLLARLLSQPVRSPQNEQFVALLQKAMNPEPTTPSGQPPRQRPSRAERIRIAAEQERAGMRAYEAENNSRS